jgi:flagellar protein FlgJ
MRLPDAVLAPAGNMLSLTPTDNGVSLGAIAPAPAPQVTALAPADACDPDTRLDCSSPEAFVRSIWPHAKRTAEQLGVSAKALVAQAALETGWGRRLVGGEDSHNLFGIKATGWNGRRVESATHEYIGGARHDQRDSFRAYGSIHESFQDYARLMRSERYAGALAAGTDADRFARALQQAGYATDPAYAAKIQAIVDGPTLSRALASIDAPPGFDMPTRVVASLPDTTERG